MPIQRHLSGDDVLRAAFDSDNNALRLALVDVDTVNVETATINDAAIGAVGNAAVTNPASNATLVGSSKGQVSLLADIKALVAATNVLLTAGNALLTDIKTNTTPL